MVVRRWIGVSETERHREMGGQRKDGGDEGRREASSKDLSNLSARQCNGTSVGAQVR